MISGQTSASGFSRVRSSRGFFISLGIMPLLMYFRAVGSDIPAALAADSNDFPRLNPIHKRRTSASVFGLAILPSLANRQIR